MHLKTILNEKTSAICHSVGKVQRVEEAVSKMTIGVLVVRCPN